MKELSIEERAKAYDEVIKRLEDIRTGKCQKAFVFTEGLFDYLFPELKESEGELIRKGIIHNLKYLANKAQGFVKDELEERIAWLEKQKTSEEAIQYLKENHSPSEVSDFQTAMNIAVAKAYDKGVKDGLENRGQTFTKKEVDDAYLAGVRDAKQELKKISQRMISAEAKEAMYDKPAWSEEDKVMLDKVIKRLRKHSVIDEEYLDIYYWLKSLKQRIGG